jgi:hypothetical protein
MLPWWVPVILSGLFMAFFFGRMKFRLLYQERGFTPALFHVLRISLVTVPAAFGLTFLWLWLAFGDPNPALLRGIRVP